MITKNDESYVDTKLVKQGLKKMNPVFQELADWINRKYAVEVLNIYYDKIEEANGYRPRLEVIFELPVDGIKFRDKNSINYDSRKQSDISAKFAEIVLANSQKPKKLLDRFIHLSKSYNYDIENLLVIFSSFEPIAKEEANSNVTQEEIDGLKEKYGDFNFWEISKFFSRTTFFFYTDEQLSKYKNDRLMEKLRIDYFNILKKHDEFDYIKLEDFSIAFDSKENLDKNYKGNWYFYYL